jgi:AcrR family transcriptional regulator
MQESLRAVKKRRTRQAIRAAAIELFTANGVADTTVEQIAAAADISPRTFFNYFDTKEEAVSLPYGLRTQTAIAAPVTYPWHAVSTACRALATVLEADIDERDTLIFGIRLCQREPALRDQASAQRGRWEHYMLSALEPTLANRVLVNAAAGAVWASLVHWAEGLGTTSLTSTVETALDQLVALMNTSQ